MRSEVLSLQHELQANNLDVFIVTSSDYHQSEYVNEHFRFRAYLSGFSGSSATMAVTPSEAGLWTDSRYFLQAADQLDGSGITLYKQGLPGVETVQEYLRRVLPEGGRLGVDGRTVSVSYAKELKAIAEAKGGELVSIDLADKVWTGRPALTGAPVWRLGDEYAGKSAADKLADIRKAMAERSADLHVISGLDDIAWILNLRGGDIRHTPVFYSYLTIGTGSAVLYGLTEAYTGEIRAYLQELGVELHPYDSFYDETAAAAAGKKIMMDPAKSNYELYNRLAAAGHLIETANPSILMKSMKNDVEAENLRKANIMDGRAMVRFLYWVKTNVGKIRMTEISAADYLEKCRREEGAIDLSFGTIAGYGPHGAIVHYSATPETDAEIRPEGLFLVDSGGHYMEGSTDITRTIAVGPLTDEMKLHYTLVLKGNIDLAKVKFAQGCCGANLDVLAHMALWEHGLDYGHGTGHGIGYLLGVHEGPQSIHWRAARVPLQPGMLTSDEPGLYIEGSHGIRIENDLLCVNGSETPFGKLLEFETMTLCPIDKEPIIKELLTADEIAYLNAYHERVYELLAPGLEPGIAEWLKEATAAL